MFFYNYLVVINSKRKKKFIVVVVEIAIKINIKIDTKKQKTQIKLNKIIFKFSIILKVKSKIVKFKFSTKNSVQI